MKCLKNNLINTYIELSKLINNLKMINLEDEYDTEKNIILKKILCESKNVRNTINKFYLIKDIKNENKTKS